MSRTLGSGRKYERVTFGGETREERRARKGCDPRTGHPLDRTRGFLPSIAEAALDADTARYIRRFDAERRRAEAAALREWEPFDRLDDDTRRLRWQQ